MKATQAKKVERVLEDKGIGFTREQDDKGFFLRGYNGKEYRSVIEAFRN